MKITRRQLRRIIAEAYSYKDPYPSRRKQQKEQHWVIVCDWTSHKDPSKHKNGEQVYAEYFGTEADAKRKALQYQKEIGVPMTIEPSVEDVLGPEY